MVAGNINSRNPNSPSLFENPFVKTLAIALLMGIFLVDMGLGLFDALSSKSSPLPLSFVLMIFAVMFIGGMVFYEKQGLNPISSVVAGAFAGFGLSFVFVTLVGGVQFALDGGISTLGWEQVISAVAACMIAGIIMIKALSHKLENHSY